MEEIIKYFLLEEETGKAAVKTLIPVAEAKRLVASENDGYHQPMLNKIGEHLFWADSDGKGWSFTRRIVVEIH